MAAATVLILADDLIWSSRLADLVLAVGREPRRIRTLAVFATELEVGSAAIIDLTARTYDGIAGVEMAAHVQARVLCVGQHDDLELRRRALDAGAERVLPYRALFERGVTILTRWLDGQSASDSSIDEDQSTGGAA